MALQSDYAMEQTANLCAQVPASLLARIREEQEKAGMPRGEYITQILTTYYETQSRKGDKTMEFTKTLAFQIPEELFNRIKDHLERERQRTGRKLSQKDFVIGLIKRELEAAGQREAGDTEPQENDSGDGSSEQE